MMHGDIAAFAKSERLLATCRVCAISVIGLFALLTFTNRPLGISEEWAWTRVAPDELHAGFGVWEALMAATLLSLALFVGWRGADECGNARDVRGMLALVLLAATWQIAVECATGGALGKWTKVLASERLSGAYTTAAERFCDLNGLVRGYYAAIEPLPPSHVSANPAGLPAMYRGLLIFFDRYRGAAAAIVSSLPDDTSRATEGSDDSPTANRVARRATLLIAAIMSRAIGILSVLAAAWFAGARSGCRAAWIAGAAVGLMPAATLFAPRCDTVYPTLALTIAGLAYFAMSRRSAGAAALAGFSLWFGMWMSLVFVAVGALVGLFVLLEWQKRARLAATEDGSTISNAAWKLTLASAAGWLIGPLTLYAAWRHNVFTIWEVNLAKNGEFNLQNGRSYHLWIWANLIELAVAMGVPASLFLAAGLARQVRAVVAGGSPDSLAVSWCAVIVILNFAGLNRGEVARLWLPLMPFGVIVAAEAVAAEARREGRWITPAFIASQATVCLMLARYVRVMG